MNVAGRAFSRLTFREKLLLSLAAAMVLFTMGRQLVFEPLAIKYSSKQLQLKELVDQKVVLASRLEQVDALRARLSDENTRNASLKRELAVLNGSMTQNDQLKPVLDLLEEMARESDMILLDISVDPKRPADSPPVLFNKNLISLSVASSYKSLARFMRRLSMLPLAMSISRIDISSDPMAQSSGVTARLSLALYSSL